ncbi:hypothetical protein [Citricoccus sp. K5]|uniref:hypothetical protein n=1 Tax=Citricoccus sp. K5 TaxID=2653135 RepID=UPI0012EFA941|nr:hypothetical protein [Citricoccus sp. K5]VXA92342.1 hypothetical protein CITRIK5_100016 [Citricoccus sp. K5]VXA94460.1 hypothetical protein CITRIK5_100082 [Citricoccus sp. K5]
MRLISLGATVHANADHITHLQTELIPERNAGVVIIHLTGGAKINYQLDRLGVPLAKQADDIIKQIQEAARG